MMSMIVFRLGGMAVCSYSYILHVCFFFLLTPYSIAFPSYGAERGLLVLGYRVYLPAAA
jgi:hypothetical protein